MHRSDSLLSVVDLGLAGRGAGVDELPVCPAFPRECWSGPCGPGDQAVTAVGGPTAAVNRWSQSAAQGQFAGSRRCTRRAERTGRAGMLISCRRIVAVVALAWKREASAPAARV